MKKGAREEDWHIDGGASVLHAALTLFGSRTVEVETQGQGCISLEQRQGSFYIGSFTALHHRVLHRESPEGTFGEGPHSEEVEIAIMLRTDVFRAARARCINSTPGPAELYHIVNREVAKHIAQHPFYLPDLSAVIAASRRL